jgi:uncharacterized protein (DUF1015 family)
VADILPFHALYFNPARVSLGSVLSPPYDVISAAQRDELYARDPRNVVRLEYSREVDPYSDAERMLHEWLRNGVLTHDDRPSIYLLCQIFRGRRGEKVRRNGFIALCKLEEPEKRTVLPHEKTFPKPKEDRLKLLARTKAMFSPIFSMYVDPSHLIRRMHDEVSSTPPLLSGELDGVSHTVWKLSDAARAKKLQEVIKNSQIFIADGHHRYETALEHQRVRRGENPEDDGLEGHDFTLMYFSNMEEEGLVIFPIHRVIRRLRDFDAQVFLDELSRRFDVQQFESGDLLVHALAERGRLSFGIAIANERKYHLASLRNAREVDELVTSQLPKELKQLDVVLLHEYLIPRLLNTEGEPPADQFQIEFVKDESEALASVNRGEAQAAFLLNPTPVKQVKEVALAGLTMPQKTTYFYPKLPAGLVMYDLESLHRVGRNA